MSAPFRWPCTFSAALFRWPCSASIHLSPRSVTVAFYSFVSQVCRCWCPPFSVGHVAFLFACLPGLLLLVSAQSAGHVVFRGISIHLSPRFVAAGVRPFPLTMQRFYSSPRPVHVAFRFISGDKGRQKGDKAATMTDKRKQKGDNDQQEGKQEGRQRETEGRQGGHSDQ